MKNYTVNVKPKRKKISLLESPLYIPTLMPDEFWCGYFGRLLLVNNIKHMETLESANQYFNNLISHSDQEKINASMSYKLALISQIPHEKFVQYHTLIPLIITRNLYNFRPTKKPIVFNEYSRKFMKKGVCFCKECTEEDIDNLGFTYWRRTHQLIGVDWCLKHDCGLYTVYIPNAMNLSPCSYLKNNKYSNSDIDQNLRQNRYIKKFITIIQYLSITNHNFNYTSIVSMIHYQSNVLHHNSTRLNKILLSDLLIEKIPLTWREKHFRKLNKTTFGDVVKEFDLIHTKDDPKLINILLLASVLFPHISSLPYKLMRNIPSLEKAIGSKTPYSFTL